MTRPSWMFLLVVSLAAACSGDDEASVDGGAADGGEARDAGGAEDAGEARDAGEERDAAALPRPSLTVNGSEGATEIAPGDPIEIRWSADGASACAASGTFPGWAGELASTGTRTLTDTASLAVDTVYTVQLSCSSDSAVSERVERTVRVVGPTTVPCEERALLGQGALSDWVRKTTGPNSCVWANPPRTGLVATADCRFFDQVWPRPWPGSGNTRNLTVFGNEGRQFIAMEFDSGNIPADHRGRMTQEVPQFDGANAGFKLWSISRCPGDYNAELIEAEMGPGCVWREEFGFTQSFEYGGPDHADDPRRCALEPHTRYYLNLVWTSALPGTAPEDIVPTEICATERCGMNAVPGGLYFPD